MTLLSSRTAIALLATMCACVTGGLLAGPTAHAQGWLEGRDRAEGPGFRVGNLELHPGLGAELGYDSNVFLSSDAAGVDPIETSPILRVTPHLFLSTLGPQRAGAVNSSDSLPVLDFRTGVSASVYHYFDTRAPSNVELKADALMTLLPQRPFSITILGAYGRTIRPFTEKGALGDNYEHWVSVQKNHGWQNRFDPAANAGNAGVICTDDRNPAEIWMDRIDQASRQEVHEFFGPYARIW